MRIAPRWDSFLLRAVAARIVVCALTATGMVLSASMVLAQPETVNPNQVDNLIKALESPEAEVRLASAVFMGNLAPKARERFPKDADAILAALRNAGPKLAHLLDDADPQVRVAAMASMGRTQSAGAVMGPALLKAMKSSSVELKLAAAEAVVSHVERTMAEMRSFRPGEQLPMIASYMTDSAAFYRPLSVGLEDADAKVQLAVLQSLEQLIEGFARLPEIFPPDAPAGDASLSAIRQGVSTVAVELKNLISILGTRLNGPNEEVQAAAAKIIESLADLTREHGNTATRGRLLKPDFAAPGKEAAELLLAELQKCVPTIADALRGKTQDAQLAILDALEALNSRAKGAVPAIVGVLDSPSPFVRWSAARILGKIQPTDQPNVVKSLAKLLQDEDADVKLAACDALKKYGPQAAVAIPELSLAVKGDDPDIQVAAIETLRAVGGKAVEAVEPLTIAAKSKDVRVRREVAKVLGQFGAQAKSAIPTLRELLADGDLETRQAASESLLQIQGFTVGN